LGGRGGEARADRPGPGRPRRDLSLSVFLSLDAQDCTPGARVSFVDRGTSSSFFFFFFPVPPLFLPLRPTRLHRPPPGLGPAAGPSSARKLRHRRRRVHAAAAAAARTRPPRARRLAATSQPGGLRQCPACPAGGRQSVLTGRAQRRQPPPFAAPGTGPSSRRPGRPGRVRRRRRRHSHARPLSSPSLPPAPAPRRRRRPRRRPP